jgi:SSS family solute:Na+ symporter/sodium/pantothenate symporter
MSTIILIGLSGAVYPHAIQRVYAARDTATLKRSLTLMVFMPLVTMTPIVLVGIWGIVHFDGLGRIEADQLMPLFLTEWASGSALLHALSVLVFVGTVAAIMSTADSVLLSLSSILTKDVLGKTWLRGATDEALTRAGKQLSWLIVAVLVGVALVPRVTLWGLTELKMEILVQVAPLFILGIHWRRLAAAAALSGLVAGTLVASGLTLAGLAKVGGLHAGLIGLLANLSLCWALSLPQIGRARQALSSQA